MNNYLVFCNLIYRLANNMYCYPETEILETKDCLVIFEKSEQDFMGQARFED